MPNYGLVVTPQYNPMSYEQYAKPFEDYAKVYNQMADAYDALEMEANQWEKLANSDVDSPQYEQYKKYANDLRAAANELSENGLSVKTRGAISNMRKRYAGEIKPIEEAYNYRQKMAEEQRKLNPKGDMQFDVDFSRIGLGEIMKNPTLSYRGRSLSEIENEATEQAKAASSRRVVSRKAKELGNQYYQILQGYGKTEAAKFLNSIRQSNPSEYKELDALYNSLRTQYGTNSETSIYSGEQNQEADERILNGMMKGLVLQDSYQTNHWAMPSARSGGSGKAEPAPEHIGYETVTKDKDGKVTGRYTVIDEGGVIKYYKHNPDGTTSSTPMTPEEIRKSGVSESKVFPRYYAAQHNTNADLVYVTDAATGMRVTQDGKVVTYNRKTQRWNPITKQVEDIPGAKSGSGNSKTQVLPSPMKVVVSNSNNSTKKNNTAGKSTTLTKEEATKAISGATPRTFAELSNDELAQVPDIVKKNPGKYLFYSVTEDADYWWTGDNTMLYIVPVSSATHGNEEDIDTGENDLE